MGEISGTKFLIVKAICSVEKKKKLGSDSSSHALAFLPAPHQISLVDVLFPGLKTLLGLTIGMEERILKIT